jgi:hypothetical protein
MLASSAWPCFANVKSAGLNREGGPGPPVGAHRALTAGQIER